jgi:hypothetical protein
LPHFFVAPRNPDRIAGYAEQRTSPIALLLFLLPKQPKDRTHRLLSFVFVFVAEYSAGGTPEKKIARFVILGFILKMIRAIIADSKLCAEVPRHATGSRLSAGSVAQLGKEGETPSVASFPVPRYAAPETVPVSVPSGRRGFAASASWSVCP